MTLFSIKLTVMFFLFVSFVGRRSLYYKVAFFVAFFVACSAVFPAACPAACPAAVCIEICNNSNFQYEVCKFQQYLQIKVVIIRNPEIRMIISSFLLQLYTNICAVDYRITTVWLFGSVDVKDKQKHKKPKYQ